MKKTIFYIDANSAFLSWRAVYCIAYKSGKQDWREIPSAIGGDMAIHYGTILAKSISAKKYDI